MMLCGCSSKKTTSRGSSGYIKDSNKTETITVLPDYSKEHIDAMGMELVEEARSWIGTPYVFGGQDKSGTDCSGLVMEIYRKVCWIKIPRTTINQKQYCTEMARNRANIGDLIFFGQAEGSGNDVTHVGLYIGKGEMIHASSSRGVMVSNVDQGYWGKRFRGVGRVEGAQASWVAHTGNNSNNLPNTIIEPDPLLIASKISITNSTPTQKLSTKSDKEITLEQYVAMTNAQCNYKTSETVRAITTEAPPQTDVSPTSSIDFLDEIINQKVDSIFSTRFMD